MDFQAYRTASKKEFQEELPLSLLVNLCGNSTSISFIALDAKSLLFWEAVLFQLKENLERMF